MSNLKMSECFSLPVEIVTQRNCCDDYESIVRDSYGDFMFVLPDDIDVSAVVHAINFHDSMTEQIVKQQKEIEELVEALDKLLVEAYCSADQVNYEYCIGKQVYDESIINAEKVLSKYNDSIE